jgi:hypothetical protein
MVFPYDKQNSSKIIIVNAVGKVVYLSKYSQDKGFEWSELW